MAKIGRVSGINSTDEVNKLMIDHLDLEGFLNFRKVMGDEELHLVNGERYLKKMLIFKCIELDMEGENIMKIFDLKERCYGEWLAKYRNYNRGHVIIYPKFLVGVMEIDFLCNLINYCLKFSKKNDQVQSNSKQHKSKNKS